VGGLDDGGEVLDFHGYGAGAFAPEQSRAGTSIGVEERADVGVRGVERGLDAKTAEDDAGEPAVGAVGVFWNENVVASFEAGEVH